MADSKEKPGRPKPTLNQQGKHQIPQILIHHLSVWWHHSISSGILETCSWVLLYMHTWLFLEIAPFSSCSFLQ